MHDFWTSYGNNSIVGASIVVIHIWWRFRLAAMLATVKNELHNRNQQVNNAANVDSYLKGISLHRVILVANGFFSESTTWSQAFVCTCKQPAITIRTYKKAISQTGPDCTRQFQTVPEDCSPVRMLPAWSPSRLSTCGLVWNVARTIRRNNYPSELIQIDHEVAFDENVHGIVVTVIINQSRIMLDTTIKLRYTRPVCWSTRRRPVPHFHIRLELYGFVNASPALALQPQHLRALPTCNVTRSKRQVSLLYDCRLDLSSVRASCGSCLGSGGSTEV
ncbi:hypothetical protein JG688_00011490, partial [Phytophthora aleatoria]